MLHTQKTSGVNNWFTNGRPKLFLFQFIYLSKNDSAWKSKAYMKILKEFFLPLQQSNLLILIGTCQESYFLRLFLFINSVQNLLDEIAYGV